MCSINKHSKGFTLIELMIVISIISFLSSVILGNITKARVNARDAQRISDIRQMRIALEIYRNTYGDYPSAGPWIYSTDASWNTTSALQTALTPYMKKLPVDPVNNAASPWVDGNYSYVYGYAPGSYSYSTTKRYDLAAQFENKSNSSRCELKNWMTGWDATIWCPTYSKYIYTGEY